MVCIRCKMVVKSELENLGLPYSSIELGEAEISQVILLPNSVNKLANSPEGNRA